MRKEIKEAQYCPKCKHLIKGVVEETFCDFCGKQLPSKKYPLKLTVFPKGDYDYNELGRYEFCSWECVMNWLETNPKMLKRSNFATLPYLTFHPKERYVEDGHGFFEYLKKQK